MRLLNAESVQNGLFEFRDFLGAHVPDFAILSHTWEEDEVIYQDLLNTEARAHAVSKRGFAKLYGFAQQAVRDHLVWIWMDTCCIDKTSSSELSEAINSMYAWYGSANICYVYLSDVRKHPHNSNSPTQIQYQHRSSPQDKPQRISSERDLEMDNFLVRKPGVLKEPYARWFRRGWTLQELIAPQRMVFYDADWLSLGSRAKLCNALSAITGIPASVLTGIRPIHTFSAAQRMSWASSRHTTRLEDEAYCLLGLFQINMPLLYGEGRNAFARLQQAILETSDDQSLFSWGLARWQHRATFSGLLSSETSSFSLMSDVVQCQSHLSEAAFPVFQGSICVTLPLISYRRGLAQSIDGGVARLGNGAFYKQSLAVLACSKGSHLVGIKVRKRVGGRANEFERCASELVLIPFTLLHDGILLDMIPRRARLARLDPRSAPDVRSFNGDRTFETLPYSAASTVISRETLNFSYTPEDTGYEADHVSFELLDWQEGVHIVGSWPSEIDSQCRLWSSKLSNRAAILARVSDSTFFLLLLRRRSCKMVKWTGDLAPGRPVFYTHSAFDEGDIEDIFNTALESSFGLQTEIRMSVETAIIAEVRPEGNRTTVSLNVTTVHATSQGTESESRVIVQRLIID